VALLLGVSKALYAAAPSGVGHDAACTFGPGKLVADARQNLAAPPQIGESRKGTGRCSSLGIGPEQPTIFSQSFIWMLGLFEIETSWNSEQRPPW
jgi:hypothetical protein